MDINGKKLAKKKGDIVMEMTKIIESLRAEIVECEKYLENEPDECRGYDEVCIITETRKEMCERFLCMLGEAP